MALAVIIGLTAGNFIWQLLSADPNFAVAIERSFFNAVGVTTYYLLTKV